MNINVNELVERGIASITCRDEDYTVTFTSNEYTYAVIEVIDDESDIRERIMVDEWEIGDLELLIMEMIDKLNENIITERR